jgi:hypothetical protein
VPQPSFEWFLPVFVLFWLAACAALSLLGGWRELAYRFKCNEPLDGDHYRFRSGAMGWKVFPVNYGNCLFVTVSSNAFSLSILYPFRFLHPRLVIPWQEVEHCEPLKYWFMRHVAVYVAGFDRRILLAGNLGDRILEEWSQRQPA